MRYGLLLVFAVACGKAEAPREAPAPDEADDDAPVASARRPSRAHFVEHQGARCALFWQEPSARGREREVACPRELLPGERLRHTGSTCLRESPIEARRGPSRCPPALTRAVTSAAR